jgi:hypothetical protein
VQNIPYKEFTCPKCGAPGSVSYGSTTYGCMCRYQNQMTNYAPMPAAKDGCRPIEPLSERDVRRIVREELTTLGKSVTPDEVDDVTKYVWTIPE